ncbi:MAG: glycerophosphodiester phosphodiesterase [Thermus sp.]|uniref:glycerophosphodiester phosphodiesterase n=1 Tax=Thermus sp. TaxID=275 RepID=UPI00351B5772
MPIFRRKPLRLGHRGAPLRAKENTLESFRLALEAGLDGVELDVWPTKDGAFAVRHDAETPLGPVFHLPFAELKALEPETPRLEEVLELKEAFPKALLNVELKGFPGLSEEAAPRLARLLRGQEGVWVSSFDPLALLALRKAAPGLPLGFLMAKDHSALLPCLGVEAVHPHHALVTEAALEGWRRRGLFVVAWTVNDPSEARRLLALGVDGLIGDRPEALLEAQG